MAGETHVFLALSAALLLALVLGEIAQRLNQPSLIGEILAGVLVGPHVIGLVSPTGSFALFATIGGVLLLFDAGYEEVDVHKLLEAGRPAAAIAMGGLGISFILGAGTGFVFGYAAVPALFIGLALAATSIAVTVRVLMELDAIDTRPGLRVVGAAVLDDVLTLLGFSTLLAYATTTGSAGVTFILSVLKILAFLAAVYVFYRFVLLPFAPRVTRLGPRGGTFVAIMGVLFLFAYAAEYAGLDPIVGAFAIGLALGKAPHMADFPVRQGMVGIAYGVFIPLFFIIVGARFEPGVLLTGDPLVPTIVVLGILGKIAGGYLGNRVAGGDARESLIVGVGMVPRTGVELALLTAALAAGLVDQRIFSAIIALVLVSVLFTPPVLKRLLAGRTNGTEEQGNAGGGNGARG